MESEAIFDARNYFSGPLTDMADLVSADMAGVLVPDSEIGQERLGLTQQFLDNADEYHRKYTDTAYYRWMIEQAVERAELELQAPVILDMGSGSGNSVLPCLQIFDDCHIIATDLSPNLLKILANHLNSIGCTQQVTPVCMDATRDIYREDSFDLVIGAAILHHLINPENAVMAVCKALKPSAHAVFFEPFEAGHAILRIAYTEILRQAEKEEPLDRQLVELLEALIVDFQVRTGSDKSADIFRKIDDKWLFTKSYFEEIASRLNMTNLMIYPLHGIERPFSFQTETYLRLGAELEPEALAPWAWDILGYYDSVFSDELKKDLVLEGAIILTK